MAVLLKMLESIVRMIELIVHCAVQILNSITQLQFITYMFGSCSLINVMH